MNVRTFHVGLRVSPMPYLGVSGGTVYAEIEPSGVHWWRSLLPHVGRWWFEVHHDSDADGKSWTFAYERGGSGGAYTFRGCVRKATQAVEEFAAIRQPLPRPDGVSGVRQRTEFH